MKRIVKLGMVTVLMRREPVETRREKLLDLVDDAGKAGCQIVLLPEFADMHVTEEKIESNAAAPSKDADPLREMSHTLDSPWLREIADRARSCGMVVIPDVRLLDGENAFNAAIVYGPDGTILGQYRKTHLAPGEELSVSPGDSLEPIETPFGSLGIFICYDVNFPEIARCYELRGAEILLWTTMRQVTLEYAQYAHILPATANIHGMPLCVSTYVEDTEITERRPMTSVIYNCFGQVVAGGARGRVSWWGPSIWTSEN